MRDTKVKVDSVNLFSGEAKKPYIFLRQGGLSFDAKSSRIYICASGRLFIPEVLAKGALSLAANGAVSRTLVSGVFAEDGKRSCTETGAGQFLTGVPGASAGATVGPCRRRGGRTFHGGHGNGRGDRRGRCRSCGSVLVLKFVVQSESGADQHAPALT